MEKLIDSYHNGIKMFSDKKPWEIKEMLDGIEKRFLEAAKDVSKIYQDVYIGKDNMGNYNDDVLESPYAIYGPKYTSGISGVSELMDDVKWEFIFSNPDEYSDFMWLMIN